MLCILTNTFIADANTAQDSPGYQVMLSKLSLQLNSKGTYITHICIAFAQIL